MSTFRLPDGTLVEHDTADGERITHVIREGEPTWPDLSEEMAEYEPPQRPGPRYQTADYGALWSVDQIRAAQDLRPIGDRKADRAESDRHRSERRASTTPEMLARLDAVLNDADAGQTAGDMGEGSTMFDAVAMEAEQRAGGLLPTGPSPDLPEVDNPIRRGPEDTRWVQVAQRAWEDLTGETELPDWFDEFTTIGELARQTGRDRSEITEALDRARAGGMVWYQGVSSEDAIDALVHAMDSCGLINSIERFNESMRALCGTTEGARERLGDNLDGTTTINFQADFPSVSEALTDMAERWNARELVDRQPNRAERRGQRTRPGHVSPYNFMPVTSRPTSFDLNVTP